MSGSCRNTDFVLAGILSNRVCVPNSSFSHFFDTHAHRHIATPAHNDTTSTTSHHTHTHTQRNLNNTTGTERMSRRRMSQRWKSETKKRRVKRHKMRDRACRQLHVTNFALTLSLTILCRLMRGGATVSPLCLRLPVLESAHDLRQPPTRRHDGSAVADPSRARRSKLIHRRASTPLRMGPCMTHAMRCAARFARSCGRETQPSLPSCGSWEGSTQTATGNSWR